MYVSLMIGVNRGVPLEFQETTRQVCLCVRLCGDVFGCVCILVYVVMCVLYVIV